MGQARGVASVDGYFLAGDEGGGVAGEEKNGGGDVLGGSHVGKGDAGGVLGELGGVGVGVALDGNPAGGYQIDGDAGGAELPGPGAGEAKLGALGGDVGGEARIAELEDLAADHEDAAETRAASCREEPAGGAGGAT